MEFDVNELLERAKETADTVARETGKAVNVQKKRLNILNLKTKLNRDYETLGRVYYASLEDDTKAQALEDAVAAVADRLAELEEVRRALADEQDRQLCPFCGAPVERDSAFCRRCGASLKK